MNLLIIHQKACNAKNFFACLYIFFLLIIIVASSVNVEAQIQPKRCEYGELEITVTIRRYQAEKVISKWAFAAWIFKCTFCWMSIAAMALLAFGQWGLPISWIAMRKATIKGRIGLSLLCGRPIEEIMLPVIKNIVKIVLIAVVCHILSVSTQAEIAREANHSVAEMAVVVNTCVAAKTVFSPTILKNKPKLAEFQAQCELFRERYKITIEQQLALYEKLSENPQMCSRVLLCYFPDVKITINQLNRIRKEWGLSRKQGRPSAGDAAKPGKEKQPSEVLTHIPKAGLKLFAVWLEESNKYQEVLETIYELIEQYKKEHPEEDFRLLKHNRETIAKKWKALNLLALAGIKKLTELDYQQHDLDRILVDGESYSNSALRQFLGDLERINAGASLKSLLAKSANGNWAYIDGHMIALWSKLKCHKGYITMLGRIMPGSKLVATHDELGQAIAFEYYPPDTHLTHIIEEYCQAIVDLTGITNFVVDREINSVEIGRLFDKHRWGLICLLDANEYGGLDSFKKYYSKVLPDGTILYKAVWKHWRDDPRYFVIVKEKDRTLVYWYTRQIKRQNISAEQIVNIYRCRGEVQENSFKRMKAHGALESNFGHKKLWGPDRTLQRRIDKLDKKIEQLNVKRQKLQKKLDDQTLKIHESRVKNHGRLLEKRLDKFIELESQDKELGAKIKALELRKQEELCKPSLRADRDFRKQTIMTFRTLWIENMLRDFVFIITDSLKTPIDIEVILIVRKLLFNLLH